jgi:hypothetical protein
MLYTRISGERFGQVPRKLECVSNCWICEGWSEVEFSFTPTPEMGEVDKDVTPIKLHLQADEYAGELLMPISTSSQLFYNTSRMLPPGSQKFYYTVDGKQFVDERFATVENRNSVEIPRYNYIK